MSNSLGGTIPFNGVEEYWEKPKTYGYFRVFRTDDQQTIKHLKRITTYYKDDYTERTFIDEKGSKYYLNQMMDILTSKDTIIVPSLERLSLSFEGVMDILDRLKKKGVKFEFIEEKKYSLSQIESYIEIYNHFQKMSEKRKKEGIELSKKEGKYKGGRKPISTPNFSYYLKELENGKIKTKSECIRKLGMSKSTFYRKYKQYKERKKKKSS